MFFVGFPDWKKIGWHAGKKLRDILHPPVDTGPSREERRAQRLRDCLKGFVYFDDYDEVESWSPNDIDPVQQANTPLLERSASKVHNQQENLTSLLLCHDYNGGYHDYESVRPPPLDREWYSCDYLQYVNTFVYFSHKLLCVPPPVWTNTMHRNGAKVLGTFMVETQTSQMTRMLQQKDGEYILVDQLAAITQAFGFDGWLLNIEAEFPSDVQHPVEKLAGFVRHLKRSLGPSGSVVWYDAITIDNEVEYQNGLTLKNVYFALAADAVFTNYKWTENELRNSQNVAKKCGIRAAEVHFGIDVWAQNMNMQGPPRVTFPSNGGGGTNTGVAMSVLAKHGFSTAIFGGAWSHEHFTTIQVDAQISIAEAVKYSMWEGKSLPTELGCDCLKGRPHHTSEYTSNPIVASACEMPAGSLLFFETDFQGAFVHPRGLDSKHILLSTLGSQSVIPHLLPMSIQALDELNNHPPMRILYAELLGDPCQSLIVRTKIMGNAGKLSMIHDQQAKVLDGTKNRLCLFKLNMLADGSLTATIRFNGDSVLTNEEIGFYTAYGATDFQIMEYEYHSKNSSARQKGMNVSVIDIRSKSDLPRLLELGAYCVNDNEVVDPQILYKISSITIKPQTKEKTCWSISGLRTIQRGQIPHCEKRIAWTWNGRVDTRLIGLPWSATTGPFSHFKIMSRGRELGRAYSTEFTLRQDDFDTGKEEDGDVGLSVEGIMFGGGQISSLPIKVPKTIWQAF